MWANLDALRALLACQTERRPPTEQEQARMARWAGWGAAPALFDERTARAAERYAAERLELQQLVGDDGYQAARRTTLNAHYTDGAYAQAIWDALGRMGFTGGRVLEPGCGSGNFIGFAPDGVQAVGVELDPTTAAIAQALYPDAQIRAESFADTRLAAGAFDLVVGNVPFGSIRLHDPVHNPDRRHPIHNHFILKSLALTRPGGTVALITSQYTMDGSDTEHREARAAMADLADLVAAIRLPNVAHETAAGTNVVTDLLIFRRRADHEPPNSPAWLDTNLTQLPGWNGAPTESFHVNDYFRTHPEMVLGTMVTRTGRERPKLGVNAQKGTTADDLRKALDRVVAHAQSTGLTHTPATTAEQRDELEFHQGDQQEGFITDLGDGRFTQIQEGRAVPHKCPKTQIAELRALLGLRDTVVALLDEEAAHGADTPHMAQLRAELNTRYDRYLTRYGPINRYTASVTTRYDEETGEETGETERRTYPQLGGFRHDPFYPYVAALEKFDDDTQEAEKADIFTGRVVVPPEPITRVDTPDDALIVCWDLHNEIRLDVVARLLSLDSEDQARDVLGTLVYDEPGTGRLIRRAEYLSGNVRRKLAIAEQAAAADPRFEPNVEALRAVLPRDKAPAEMGATLGSPWISAAYVQEFLREILEDPELTVKNAGARWTVDGGDRSSMMATVVWGTDRRSAHDLAEQYLNGQTIEITDTIGRGADKKTIKNTEATTIAQAKAAQIDQRFRDWLWEDPDRATDLARTYNDRFNSVVNQSYAGVHVTAPGLSVAFKPLRPHQMEAVAQIRDGTYSGTGLFHGTGAGKTLEMIVGGMELKRLGLIRKPVYVVPKGVLDQFHRDFLQAYPRARVLAAEAKDLEKKDKRRRFVARCSTGNWDAIIINHDAFKRIPVDRDTQVEYLKEQKARLEKHLANSEDADRFTIKGIEKQLTTLGEKLDKVLDQPSDPATSFERTGIDFIFGDEWHVYKNLQVISSIKELAHEGNQITADMEMKLQYLRRSGRKRVVCAATATPFDNSPAELLSITKLVAPEVLEEMGIEEDDQYLRTFVAPRRRVEMTADGTRFESRWRWAQFINVQTQKLHMNRWANVKLKEHLNLGEPDIIGGKQQILSVPASTVLREYLGGLGIRARDLKARTPQPRVKASGELAADNILWISTDGRKASLDLNLVGLHTDEPQKTDVLADWIAETWHAHKDDIYYDVNGNPDPVRGSLILFFCDLGVPSDRWNVYDDLRAKLIARDLPAGKIRYAHDAKNPRQRAQLTRDAWNGHIGVLMGSRKGLGTGLNLQRRVIAVVQGDPTWKLTPIEQSLGRGKRQGNANPGIHHVVTVTEGSYDPFFWQKVDDKKRWTTQMLDPNDKSNTIEVGEDTGGRVDISTIFAVAAGRPELIEMDTVEQALATLRLEAKMWHDQQFAFETTIKQNNRRIATTRSVLADVESAIARRVDTRGDAFTMTIDGRIFDKRAEAGGVIIDRLHRAAAGLEGGRRSIHIGQLGGFDLWAAIRYPAGLRPVAEVRFLAEGTETAIPAVQLTDDEFANPSRTGLVRRLENRIADLDELREKNLARIAKLQATITQAEERVGKPFPQQAELDGLANRFRELEAALESISADARTGSAAAASPSPQGGRLAGPSGAEHGRHLGVLLSDDERARLDQQKQTLRQHFTGDELTRLEQVYEQVVALPSVKQAVGTTDERFRETFDDAFDAALDEATNSGSTMDRQLYSKYVTESESRDTFLAVARQTARGEIRASTDPAPATPPAGTDRSPIDPDTREYRWGFDAGFGDGRRLNSRQSDYLEMIIAELDATDGAMQQRRLYEPPYTDVASTGPESIFDAQDVKEIFATIRFANGEAAPPRQSPHEALAAGNGRPPVYASHRAVRDAWRAMNAAYTPRPNRPLDPVKAPLEDLSRMVPIVVNDDRAGTNTDPFRYRRIAKLARQVVDLAPGTPVADAAQELVARAEQRAEYVDGIRPVGAIPDTRDADLDELVRIGFSTSTPELFESVRVTVERLEVDSRTDPRLTAAARVNALDQFESVGPKWVDDWMAEALVADEHVDVAGRYFDSDTQFKRAVDSYLTEQIWRREQGAGAGDAEHTDLTNGNGRTAGSTEADLADIRRVTAASFPTSPGTPPTGVPEPAARPHRPARQNGTELDS